MSNRSPRFHRLKQALTQAPATGPASTWSPVPLDGDPRRPARNFTNPRQLPGLERMTASDGLTVLMPVVRPAPTQILPPIQAAQDAANLSATQVLPALPVDAPPSAAHVNPAKQTTTFAEDNDLEPESRGRHVLDELAAGDIETGMPDLVGHDEPALVVRGAYGRIVAALAPQRPESLADAVRIARRAYEAGRGNRRWFAEEETKLDACRRRIAEFNADWDEHLRGWNAAVCGQEAVIAGYSLAATYEENRQRIAEANARRVAEGQPPLDATATTFTRGMAAELKELIVQRATAGSAVAA